MIPARFSNANPLCRRWVSEQFKLLELVPKMTQIQIHERVYIGDGERDKIERVKRGSVTTSYRDCQSNFPSVSNSW